MTNHDKHHAALWDLVVQRGVADAGYRARLLASAHDAVEEVGLETAGLDIVVHELTDRLRIIILPPTRAVAEVPQNRMTGGRPYSDEPQSEPITGSAWCALSDRTDPRVNYGTEESRG